MGENTAVAGADWSNPAFVMAIVSAFIGDLFSALWVAVLFVPVSGIPAAMVLLLGRYFVAAIVAAMVYPKITKGSLLQNVAGAATLDVSSILLLIAKILLGIAIILPLPFLVIGIVIAIILANKFVQKAANVALLLAGPELKLAGAAGKVAGKAAGAAAKGARAAARRAAREAGGAVAGAAEKVAGAAARGAREAGGAVAGAERAAGAAPTALKKEIPKELLGEEPTPFEKLEKLAGEEALGETGRPKAGVGEEARGGEPETEEPKTGKEVSEEALGGQPTAFEKLERMAGERALEEKEGLDEDAEAEEQE